MEPNFIKTQNQTNCDTAHILNRAPIQCFLHIKRIKEDEERFLCRGAIIAMLAAGITYNEHQELFHFSNPLAYTYCLQANAPDEDTCQRGCRENRQFVSWHSPRASALRTTQSHITSCKSIRRN